MKRLLLVFQLAFIALGIDLAVCAYRDGSMGQGVIDILDQAQYGIDKAFASLGVLEAKQDLAKRGWR